MGALPKLTDVEHAVPVHLDEDTVVVFILTPIPGQQWDDIHTASNGEPVDLSDPPEWFCEQLLTAGVSWVETPGGREPFTTSDAEELWRDWPQHARLKVLGEVFKFNRAGVDPKADTTPNATGG